MLVLTHYSFYVFSVTLPAYRPNFTELPASHKKSAQVRCKVSNVFY